MRYITPLASVVLAISISGCVTVPVWTRDVAQLDKLGKGLSVAEVDKIFGRSTLLKSATVDVEGKTYLLRHYQLAEETGRQKIHTVCQARGGCMTSFTPITVNSPFAVVFVGIQPQLAAWGKVSELNRSTDPEVVAVRRQLNQLPPTPYL